MPGNKRPHWSARFAVCLIIVPAHLALAQPLEEIRVNALGSRGVVFSGTAPHTFEEYLSPAGDVNGDGLSDVLLVSTNFEADHARTVYLVYGHADLPSTPTFGELPELATTFERSTPRFRTTDALGSVDAAGDIDGDGFDDFLIMRPSGAPDGWTGANEIPGLVYLVYGSDELPRKVPLDTPTPGVRITRFTSTKNTRTSLAKDAASGGDVNGDGKSDIILGAGFSYSDAREYEWGPGRVYVIFGGTELAGLVDVEEVGKTVPGLIIEGSVDGEWLGYTVEFAGDVDGDGIDEFLAGAPSPRGWQPGAAYLIYGGTDLPPAATADELIATNRVTRLDGRGSTTSVFGTASGAGRTLAAAGDLNDDGFDDFLIGSTGAKSQAGHAYLVFGHADLPADIELPAIEKTGLGVVIAGAESELFVGTAITTLDHSGDGRTDIVIGAHGASYLGIERAGIAYILPGEALEAPGPVLGTTAPPPPVSAILRHEIPLDGTSRDHPQFGHTAANAGDVNGDGFDDLLVSAPSRARPANGELTGRVFLVFGRGGMRDPLRVDRVQPDTVSVRGGEEVIIVGAGFDESTVVRFGEATAAVTRVETSARLVVEVPSAASPGAVDVVLTRDQEIARLASGIRYVPRTYPDIDVSGLATSGRGFVVSGPATNFATSTRLVDLDGDGLQDIVTMAARDILLVIYGRREAWDDFSVVELLDPRAGALPPGIATIQTSGDVFGDVLSAIGDVNADGVDDIALADRDSSTISVLLGGERYGRELLEDLLDTERGVEVLTGFLPLGVRLAVVGGEDLDGDGIDDLVVGIADFLTGVGRSALVPGRSLWPPTVFLEDSLTLRSSMPEDRFGASIASPGDVDGDGRADLLVGAPGVYFGDDGNGYIISGNAFQGVDLQLEDLLERGLAFRLDAFKPKDSLAHRVAALGDFNGDGRSDFALGAEGGGLSFHGETYVVFGGARLEGGPAAAPLSMRDLGDRGVRCLGELGDDHADEVAPAGDFNGDGLDDLLVGAPGGTGKAYVVFGGTAGTIRLDSLGGNGVRMTGYSRLGVELAGGGDVNGDGVDDVVVVGWKSGGRDAKLHVVFGESDESRFVRGDANSNDVVDLTDPVFFMGYLFSGNGELLCRDAADGNDDGRLDVADAIFVLNHLFGGGGPLPPPFPEPGVDPTADGLECEAGR